MGTLQNQDSLDIDKEITKIDEIAELEDFLSRDIEVEVNVTSRLLKNKKKKSNSKNNDDEVNMFNQIENNSLSNYEKMLIGYIGEEIVFKLLSE